jgi:glycosyltransferase involved in cell wall biosynthesis
MKKRLLFVVNVDWFFLSHRLGIAKAAMNQGYEVHIATAITGNPKILTDEGLILHHIPLNRSNIDPLSVIKYLFKLIKVFKLVQPDLVHLVTIKPVLIGGIALKFFKVPAVVFAISGMGYVYIGNKFIHQFLRLLSSIIYKLALNHPNAIVICQNADDLKLVKGITNLPRKAFTLIKGSGVDLKKFKPTKLPAQPPIIMFPARMLFDKGVNEFVEAAKRISSNQSIEIKARFVLVGMLDDGNKASLKPSDILELEQNNIVEYWGHKESMEEILPLSTVVVLPSYREGLPKVLSEAAACGRPIITTDVPGCRDVLQKNISGLLVPANNSKKLADAMIKLITTPNMCSSFGNAGRIFAEKNFSLEIIINQHIKIYQDLTEEGKAL